MTSEAPPRFRLLGQLEIAGSGLAELRGLKQRTLMAYLLLHAGQIVPTERLIAAIWGEQPPPTAAAIVHSYVRRVRSVLSNTASRLVTRPPGYILELGGESVDVQVFERLARDGRVAVEANDFVRAGPLLAAALVLWRDELLAELPAEGFVAEERARLAGLHTRARLDRIEAELSLGAGEALVPELESLVREQPFQERPRRELMLALYRAGRQADALALYRETRRQFSEELGLEPSRELKQLESAILRQDTSLDAPAKAQPALEGRKRRRRLPVLAVMAVIAVAAVVGIDLAKGTKAQPRPLIRAAPIGATLALPQPSCCGFGFNALWGVGHHDDILRRVDPATGTVTGSWHVADYQSGVPLAAAGSVWIPSAAGDLIRFDPVRHKVVARIPVSGAEMAFAYLKIWETSRNHGLDEIDLSHNRIVRAIRLAPGANDWDDELTVGRGSIWVALTDYATLLRIDPSSGRVTARIRGFGSTDSSMPIAFDENAVWVLRFVGGTATVFRVDPTTNEIVARIPVAGQNGGGLMGTIAAGDGYVWTGNWDNSISKIDERTNRVVAVYRLPALPQDVNFEDGSLWVDAYDASKVWRINPNN
jgi:DNA-binding SARP family transcriptional activator/streptogramin lyase